MPQFQVACSFGSWWTAIIEAVDEEAAEEILSSAVDKHAEGYLEVALEVNGKAIELRINASVNHYSNEGAMACKSFWIACYGTNGTQLDKAQPYTFLVSMPLDISEERLFKKVPDGISLHDTNVEAMRAAEEFAARQ